MIEYSEPSEAVAAKRDEQVNWAERIHRIKQMARRYWWIAALTSMIGLGIQDYLRLHAVPHFVSSSRMIISGRLSIPTNDLYNDEVVNFLGTQAALMQSHATIHQASDRVYTIHPEVIADEAALVSVGIEPRTSIINLNVTSSNAEYARLLLDAIMDVYLLNKKGRRNITTSEAVSAITEEISRLDAEIKSDEQKLLDFQKDNNVVFIEQQSNSSALYLVSLNNELSKLIKERDLLTLENKDPFLNNSGYIRSPDQSPEATPVPAPAPGATDSPALGVATPSASGAAPGPATGNPSAADSGPGTLAEPSPPAGAPVAAGTSSGTSDNTKTSSGEKNLSSANPVLAEQDRIEKLKIARDQLGVYLKDKHPKMIQMADAIDEEQKFLDILNQRYSKQADLIREDLDLQIKNLQQQIEVSNNNSLKLSESLGTYQQLRNKISREQGVYNKMAESIQNVDFNKSLDQENVVILEAASKASLIPPHDGTRLLIAFAIGLAVGLGLIYLLSLIDDKIDTTSQLEDNFDLPIMGQIPKVPIERRSKRVALLAENDPRHEFLEYHRNLRSAILFQSAEAPKLGSLMVCSAAPGEGKSTLATNMAIVFAHTGLRVLLIDADLRRGLIHTLFGLKEGAGLSEYLKGETTWGDAVQTTEVANLSVLPRGKVFYGAGDLLLGPAVDVLIQEGLAEYDLLLWDSAPLLAAHDAADLCPRMDGILFVTRVRRSSIGSVRTALEDLSQRNGKMLGFVLNAVDHHQPGYLKKYRYKEYYETSVVAAK